MKKVALLTSFLVLSWLFSGIAAAQVLSGSGPLDEVSKTTDPVKDTVNKTVDPVKDTVNKTTDPVKDTVNKTTDPVKDTVNKTTDPVKDTVNKTVDKVAEPVKETTNQVTKTVDKTAKDVSSSANDPAGSVPSVNDKSKSIPTGGGAADASRSNAGNADSNKVAFSTNKARKKSTGATRAEPARDTEKVAAVGKTIEPAQVKGAQVIAPSATENESAGSGLSTTGAQILTLLSLACWLVGIGAAFAWRGRTRARAATP